MSQATGNAATPSVLVHQDETLYTVALFESPGLGDARLLTEELQKFVGRGAPTKVIVDVRGLRRIDSGPYLHVSDSVMGCKAELSALATAVAVLHTGGLAAASVSGGIAMTMGSDFNVEAFTEEAPAFAWLGLSKEWAHRHRERIRRFQATPTLLRGCQSYIESHLQNASLSGCAADLGLEEAELQRGLSAEGTSFRTQLRHVRIECAKNLLLNTSEPTHRIGEQVGYRKQQNFTDAFRNATSMTPGAWRKQRRG